MKGFIRIIAIVLSALMLSSCGAYFYDLTEEETELITEYAVDVIVRHGKGTDFRLVTNAEEQLAKKRERDAAVEEMKAKMRAEEEEAQAEEESGYGEKSFHNLILRICKLRLGQRRKAL